MSVLSQKLIKISKNLVFIPSDTCSTTKNIPVLGLGCTNGSRTSQYRRTELHPKCTHHMGATRSQNRNSQSLLLSAIVHAFYILPNLCIHLQTACFNCEQFDLNVQHKMQLTSHFNDDLFSWNAHWNMTMNCVATRITIIWHSHQFS